MTLRINVLLENRHAANTEKLLHARKGLSLLIQDETTSVLFDTGPDGSFLDNARQLGIDLSALTATVLSHGHYDHCGGVAWLPDNSRIICHPEIMQERYAAATLFGSTLRFKKLSLDIDYSRHRMEYSRTPLRIGEKFIWSGEIPTAAPKSYGIIGHAGTPTTRDYIIDEGALIYKANRGLVIFIGCAHRGVINIVRHCQKITGITQICAVIGGFHLRAASPRTIWEVRQFLLQQKVEKIMGCHCTGRWGKWWLPKMVSPATGDAFIID